MKNQRQVMCKKGLRVKLAALLRFVLRLFIVDAVRDATSRGRSARWDA